MKETDQLANLMTYTAFHIGVYITLGAAVMAGGVITDIDHWWLRGSLVCMIIAGTCGGTIASEIPQYSDWATFKDSRIGPWGLRVARYDSWARVEHLAFWVGILVPALVYLIGGMGTFKKL